MARRMRTSLAGKAMLMSAVLVPLMAADCESDNGDFGSSEIIDIILAVADAIIRIIAFV